MIGSLGVPELLFILVLALLVFGPRKLPEIGRTLGRAMGEFRRATSDLKRTLDVELSAEELSKPPAPVAAPVVPPADEVAPDTVVRLRELPWRLRKRQDDAPAGATEAKEESE